MNIFVVLALISCIGICISCAFYLITEKNVFIGVTALFVAFNIISYTLMVVNAESVNKRNDSEIVDNEFYYIGAEIVDQSVAGVTVFETVDGNLYEIDSNPNWSWDCVYLLTMDDNATPYDVTDDAITVVWAEVTYDYSLDNMDNMEGGEN